MALVNEERRALALRYLERARARARRTVLLLAELAHDVERLVLLEGLVEQHHLLLRLDALVLRVGAAFGRSVSGSPSTGREKADAPSLLVAVDKV